MSVFFHLSALALNIIQKKSFNRRIFPGLNLWYMYMYKVVCEEKFARLLRGYHKALRHIHSQALG